MFSETWYHNDSDMLALNDYNHYFMNRTGVRGGGVAMHVTRRMSSELLPEFTQITADYECLSVLSDTNMFSVIYRPPSGNVSACLEFVEKLMDHASLHGYRVLLGGDLNINMAQNTSHSLQFSSLIDAGGLCNVIDTPTRVTPDSHSILDLFIVNRDTAITTAGTISYDISDHCPVFVIYVTSTTYKRNQEAGSVYRRITCADMDSFRSRILNQDWSSIYALNNPNDAYNEFLLIFLDHYNASFPYQRAKNRKNIRKPWVTQEHIKMIRKKNNLFKKFLRTKDRTVLKAFKKFRNSLNTELKKAKASYFENIFSYAYRQRPNEVWKIINQTLKKEAFCGSLELCIDNQNISGLALAERFNTHFVNLVKPLDKPCDVPLSYRCGESIFLLPTGDAEICQTFINLKNSSSKDVDSIQIKPVKYVIDLIAPCLAHIFNLVLESGCFPEAMKIAKVSVIYKGGVKNDINNYRPISILSVFSKGLEKIILHRMNNFFAKHSILTESQHGFRQGKSTQTALLTMKELVIKNIERNEFTLGIFIDYSKAFDYLNHNILLQKLDAYGVRGVANVLFQSYLCNRMQCVAIDGCVSSQKKIRSGVPQGSVLGPFLFNVYVNDIVKLDATVNFVLYADDTSLFISGPDANEVATRAEKCLSEISRWSKSNGLKINTQKTKAIIFRAKNKRIMLNKELTLASSRIEIVSRHKVLGVTFCDDMTWTCHVQSVLTSLSSASGALARCRHFFPTKAKLQIYHALFASHINYCTLVWCTTTVKNINAIHLLQKKALRCIANVPFAHTTKQLFPLYKIIPLPQTYEFRLLYSFLFSNQSFKSFLHTLSGLCKSSTDSRTRCSDNWLVPRRRTDYLLQSLTYTLPVLLNMCEKKGANIASVTRKQLVEFFLGNLL